MNLFQNPTITELSTLIACKADYHYKYDILVDNDGEVLIELTTVRHTARNKKNRFYFRGLHGIEHIGVIASRNLSYMNRLHKNLLYSWENNMKGFVDFEEITSIRTINYWLEKNNIPTRKEVIPMTSIFFSPVSPGGLTRGSMK